MRLFKDHEEFNEDIGDWDVSNVVDMREMFCNAIYFDQPLNNWNTSKVSIEYMSVVHTCLIN